MLEIGMICAEAGEKKTGWLEIEGGGQKLPLTLICGAKEGPTMMISAGVHGAEYIGVQALSELSRELDPKDTAGNVICLHVANPSAFRDYVRFFVPEDGKNLNRVFPGAADGTPTQKLAAFLESEIIGHTDYLVDLHSGGFCEALVPHVYYHGAAKPSVCAESFRIAEMTSAKFLVRSETKNGFYSHAGQCGVPAIILERGGCGLLQEEEVQQDLADVKNILRGLGFLQDLPAKIFPHRLAQNGHYLNAPASGCWYPKKQPGDRLKTGELLGEIRSIYGETLFRISAEADGVLLYQTASLGIKAGTPMIAYAELEKEV